MTQNKVLTYGNYLIVTEIEFINILTDPIAHFCFAFFVTVPDVLPFKVGRMALCEVSWNVEIACYSCLSLLLAYVSPGECDYRR